MPTEGILHGEQGNPKILQPVHLGIEIIDLGRLVAPHCDLFLDG
jgi:hypothetical protein